MSPEERKEISELISLNMIGLNARVESKYDIIDSKLDGVHKRLDVINGSVQRHEKQINEALNERGSNRQWQLDEFKRLETKLESGDNNHSINCPHKEKIQKLETENITRKEVKKANRYLLIGISILLGIFLTIQKLFIL